jgi:hypothetical protein
MTQDTNAAETLEEYCAERTGRGAAPALDVATLREEARHILGHYDKPGGYRPGSFTAALIRCWELADNSNQAKLNSQWPELGQAIYLMRSGQTEGLLAIAEGRAP